MRLRGWQLVWLFALMLGATFAGVFWLQYQQWHNLRQVARFGDDNMVWAYYQLGLEYTRVRAQWQ